MKYAGAGCGLDWMCHGMTSLPPLCLPLAASDCLHLHSTSSTSTPLLPPLLCSNSNVYLHSSYDYIAPTLGLTMDRHQTCLDLVPTPRAAIYIPLPHLSYLPDPFSLTIVGNYPFFFFNVTPTTQIYTLSLHPLLSLG